VSVGRAAESIPLFPGDGRAVVFPAAAWESVLTTPERGVRDGETLDDVLSHRGGVIASLTVRELQAMMRQPLLQANLFGFGRVAWNATEARESIADAWARQTFGDDARVYGVAKGILLSSADSFADVSSPFGLPWLGDGARPDPARAARRLAALPLATHDGIGIDRTEQLSDYPDAFAAELADPARCPERWLLAVHRVAPTRRMANGKTVVQAFYDTHFAGASQMSNALDAWEGTKGLMDAERYDAVHEQLALAARRGEIWRDTVAEWMERVTGVADEPHFVGSHAGRVEAETMTLQNYAPALALEPEDASASSYVACAAMDKECSATTVFLNEANVYRIEIGYYGTHAADSILSLSVNGSSQARWPVEQEPGTPGSDRAERFVVNGVRLRPGDHITVTGTAAVDFVDISRDPRWN
jgi:alpha-glucuronidase